MKKTVLTLLRSAGGHLSGESISTRLGISRVSVWKHIKKLQECGYEIESSGRGYRLVQSPDIPYSWELGDFEPDSHYFPELPSTMDLAREYAGQGFPHFTIVIAGRQTKGRGRLRRAWDSGDGGLFFTVLLRPRLSIADAFRINFAAALSLIAVLKTEFNIVAGVKWPNDVLVDGEKICGILLEAATEADLISHVNVGMGINVNNDIRMDGVNAVSIKMLAGRTVSKVGFIRSLLTEFQRRIDRMPADDIISEWKAWNITLGHQVRVESVRETIAGQAVDVDENGSLVVRLNDGTLKSVMYGDCFIQPGV